MCVKFLVVELFIGYALYTCSVAQLCPALCNPMDCTLPELLCPWSFPGKNTGVGCHLLLQGIFLTQGSNSHPLRWQADFYHRATCEPLHINSQTEVRITQGAPCPAFTVSANLPDIPHTGILKQIPGTSFHL